MKQHPVTTADVNIYFFNTLVIVDSNSGGVLHVIHSTKRSLLLPQGQKTKDASLFHIWVGVG